MQTIVCFWHFLFFLYGSRQSHRHDPRIHGPESSGEPTTPPPESSRESDPPRLKAGRQSGNPPRPESSGEPTTATPPRFPAGEPATVHRLNHRENRRNRSRILDDESTATDSKQNPGERDHARNHQANRPRPRRHGSQLENPQPATLNPWKSPKKFYSKWPPIDPIEGATF